MIIVEKTLIYALAKYIKSLLYSLVIYQQNVTVMWATQQERYHLDGLYHPFMVILEMVYYSVHHIIPGDLMVILWLKNVCY